MNETKQNEELPASDDVQFWGEGERYSTKPIAVDLCNTHTKDNWLTHLGYVANLDGTISCVYCPWGTQLPGYYRVVDGMIVDLRSVARD